MLACKGLTGAVQVSFVDDTSRIRRESTLLLCVHKAPGIQQCHFKFPCYEAKAGRGPEGSAAHTSR